MARSVVGPVAFVRSVGSVGAYLNDLLPRERSRHSLEFRLSPTTSPARATRAASAPSAALVPTLAT
jgi:hypothetical protein